MTPPTDQTVISERCGQPAISEQSREQALVVTQADRDAAAALVRAGAPGIGNGNKVIAGEIKGGLHDNYAIVQAFARHRIAALSHTALERALQPFALIAGQVEKMPQGACIWHANLDGLILSITREDVLRARAAISSHQSKDSGHEG